MEIELPAFEEDGKLRDFLIELFMFVYNTINIEYVTYDDEIFCNN